MNRQEIETEIAQIKADREGKRGRWPAGMKERLTELEGMLMTDETEAPAETPEPSEGMKRIMIMHHNAGMPGGKAGGAVKIYQFDVVETTAAHADALCEAGMAKETLDPVTIKVEDGKRIEV